MQPTSFGSNYCRIAGCSLEKFGAIRKGATEWDAWMLPIQQRYRI